MSSFKLLAIRPLDNCHQKYRRILKPGLFYRFINEYKFTPEKAEPAEKIIATVKGPENLYRITRPGGKFLPVTLSAVVGKNGVGKSTLFELLFLSIYIISSQKEILKDNLPALRSDLVTLQLDPVKNKTDIEKCTEQIEAQEFIENNLAVEIYYQVEDLIFCLQLNNGILTKYTYRHDNKAIKTYKITETTLQKDIKIESLFYSIVINYSIYGLNSSQSGGWLESLFHKNDGYQTPIVINPLRTDGVIDINSELHLAQSRLLANLMDDSMQVKEILDNKKVNSVIFTLDDDKLKSFGAVNLDNIIANQKKLYNDGGDEIFKKAYETLTGEKINITKAKLEVLHFDKIVKYTVKKLLKIAVKYIEYKDYYDLPASPKAPIPALPKLQDYLDILKTDKTHITLKLRQIFNCVRFNLLREDTGKQIFWNDNSLNINLSDLIDRIKKAQRKAKAEDLIEIIPVAFYKPAFTIGDGSDFHTLSSGEQQLVHTTQSLLYHLINLNTVFKSVNTKKKFSHVNIMLDEVELYFHPDFQKRMISDLLSGISKLKIDHITGINIIFSTHSPFILSDIPGSNILKLDDGAPSPSGIETFGANIHEMLADSFFLKKGFMGDFAKLQINEAITFIKGYDDKKAIDPSAKWTKESTKSFIELIGEPLIKHSMEELYYQKFGDMLDEEIIRLQAIQKSRTKQ